MIDLEKKYQDAIKRILAEHVPGCEVRVHGSRAKGTARKYSDLDLVVKGNGPVDQQKMDALRDALSESDLPIMVDVLDWYAISDGFREMIKKEYEVVRKPESPAP